jgi:glycosyltransferase involved in cell wall biosynthesis
VSSPGDRSLRIAMIGLRGLPASYGGIEHHVEQLGERLADRGHRVTVFCRTSYVEQRPPVHRGMRLRYLPTIDRKNAEAFVHSTLATVVALRGFDVVHYHGVGPTLPSVLVRGARAAAVVATIHGLDAERAKWSSAASRVLRAGTWVSANVPDATVVVSESLRDHFRARYGRETDVIVNGMTAVPDVAPGGVLAAHGLVPQGYVLWVGRLVPEKAPGMLVKAYASVPGDVPLVLVGGSSHTDGYAGQVAADAMREPRVVMPGFVYGKDLHELYANAAAFVIPSDLEGLPLTLLEAVSHGLPVVASDIPPHLEVLTADRPGARLFPAGDAAGLAAALQSVLGAPAEERAGAREVRADVSVRYSWDAAADRLEAVYRRVVVKRTRGLRHHSA